ncbi:MAG: DUF1800 family protein [Opitutaceae bacterium]
MNPASSWRGPFCAALTLLAAGALSAQSPRLVNLSTLAHAGTGANIIVSGFVIGPGSGETVLIRAVGPTLSAAPFGISGVLPDPVLTVFNSASAPIESNSGWNAADASVMSSVGAFPLISGSKDAAIVTTLPQGAYTAQVTGAGGDSGIALLEIYEVGATPATARLINLSSRTFISSGAIATAGLFVGPGSGTRTLLIRGIGPTLASFGLTGVLSTPQIAVFNSSATVIASNVNWGTPVGAGAASPAALSAAFAQSGAFPLPAGSNDSALILTAAPGSYTVQLSGVGGATGVAMIEVYDITPASSGPDTVSVSATQPNANSSAAGVFTVSRTGDTSQPLAVNYSVGGTAVPGMDYQSLPGTATIPAGSSSATITVTPITSLTSTTTTVVLSVSAGSGYAVGTGSATVTITNVPPTLYVADLRPAAGATSSTASGTATIYLSPDGSTATINISFSNLTSDEQAPHLTIGVPGTSANFVFGLNYPGQVVNQVWTFTATGVWSSAQLLAALQSGNIYVEIGSQDYPSGELTGQFLQSNGSQTFTAPPPPPAINLNAVSQTDAARFLAQATFGPTLNDINTLASEGYNAWFANQMALPETSHLTETRADAAAFPNTGQYAITQNNRQEAWWKVSVTGTDQLRQRVAFALSEIFVVSDVASSLAEQPEALANYYDLLAKDAFGTYRQLLQDVTLSPVMGNYLNMLRNAAANPAKGTSADENYAREVMQLFSIGLNFLNPDGSLVLDSTGQPIPTYNNNTIVQTANVLTGWSYDSTLANPSFTGGAADWYDPMMLFPAFHDNTLKTLIALTPSGPAVVAPASEGGAADLNTLLNALANHQNTGPFICKQLIQRLVTSNPSPDYVYRVAQVFANDGTGVRGNLGAVVKAILLDYEARSPAVLSDAGYGKLKEPLLRQTAIFRAFNVTSQDNRFPIFSADQTLGQAALRSPTVFNFFLPGYSPPGTLATAGLVAPEFQITTGTTAIVVPNTLYGSIYTPTTPTSSTLVLNLSPLTSAPDNPTLVATLNLLFGGNNMGAAATQQIVNALAALPASASSTQKAQAALELAVTAPEGAVQQ